MFHFAKAKILSATLAVCVFATCSSDGPEPEEPIDPVLIDLDWNDRPDGPYPEADARRDFRNIDNWNSRVNIQDNAVTVTLLAHELTGRGGFINRTRIPMGSEFRLSFDVMFPTDFEWGRGGKVGWGLLIGDGNTGGNRSDGNGASARMMWNLTGAGDIKFRPYLYYNDMRGTFGDNLVSGAQFPQTGDLERGKWYKISIYVKSNTGDNTDGRVTFTVDDQTILDENIRWTTNDDKRLVNTMTFQTFRGGSTEDWMVDVDTQIHLDNLKLERINN